jgi:hypothetical protein
MAIPLKALVWLPLPLTFWCLSIALQTTKAGGVLGLMAIFALIPVFSKLD